MTLTPALNRSPLRVEFEYNHDNDHFSISPFIAVSEFPLGASMVADAEVALTLFECDLPPQSPANAVWVSNAHAEIVLQDRLIDGDRPSLPLLSYGPYCLSIESFSGGLEWRRQPAGKGYFYSIEGLNLLVHGQISGYFSLISSIISDQVSISANLKVGPGMGTD